MSFLFPFVRKGLNLLGVAICVAQAQRAPRVLVQVRKAEVALLEILNFDIMAAGRNRLPSDPDTPTGVQDLGAELKRLEAVKGAPGLPAVV